MVDLPPSRRDITTAPRKDGTTDISPAVRHHDSYLESLDPGILRGRFATPRPTIKGTPLLVGGDGGGDGNERLWEYDDRHTVTAIGTQLARLSHEPFEESLFVRWHPDGRGGLPLTSEEFTVEGQTVVIPDTGRLAVADQFSFQYEYEDTEDALDFEFVGVSGASGTYPGYTISIPLPAGTQDGDFLVVAARGAVAAGGGDLTLGIASADSRISSQFGLTAPPVAEHIFTGFATASTADVELTIIPNPIYNGSADAVLMVIRGVNAVGSTAVANTGNLNTTSPTPRVSGAGAVAVTWAGNDSFGIFGPSTPDGYTFAVYSGLAYGNTTISWWYDPDGETSPAGNYPTAEGCYVFGLL